MTKAIITALSVIIYLCGAVYTFETCRPLTTRYVDIGGSVEATRRFYPCGAHPAPGALLWPVTMAVSAFASIDIEKVETVQVER